MNNSLTFSVLPLWYKKQLRKQRRLEKRMQKKNEKQMLLDEIFSFDVQSDFTKTKTKDDFIKNQRLDIELLIDYAKHLSMGQKHKLCSAIIRYIKHWDKTIITNSVKSLKRLDKMFKVLNLNVPSLRLLNTHDKFKVFTPQMFSAMATARKLPDQIQNIIENDVPEMRKSVKDIRNLTERLDVILDDELPVVMESIQCVTDMSQKFSSVIDKITSMYTGDDSVMNIVCTLNKVYLLFSVIKNNCPTSMVLSAVLNMVQGLVPTAWITTLVKNVTSSLYRTSKGMFKTQASDSKSEETLYENNTGFLGAIVNSIGAAFMGFFGTVDKNEFHDFSINVKKVNTLSTLLNATKNIFNYAIVAIEFVMSRCIKFITKKVGFVPKSFIPETLDEIYADLEYIEANNTISNSLISIASAKRIINFRDKVNNFLKTGKDNDVNKLMMVHLNFVKREAESWVKAIPPYLQDLPGSDREKPVWIYIHGTPQIGKTTVVAKALVYACAKKMNLIDEGEKWDAFVFNRNLGAPYWDGYNGHPVVSYTDIIQEVMDEAKLDVTITELTRANDGNAWGLEMAFDGVKGKGKNFFTSKLIVSDAQGEMNIGPISNRCWSKGVHLYARRTVVLHVIQNPKYAGTGGAGINLKAYAEAFAEGNFVGTKENPVCPKDAYNLVLRDKMCSGKIEHQFKDFMTGVEFISDFCAAEYGKNKDHSKSVDQFCQDLFKTQADDGSDGGYGTPSFTPPPRISLRPAMSYDVHTDVWKVGASSCRCYDPDDVQYWKRFYNQTDTDHACFTDEEACRSYYGTPIKKITSGLKRMLQHFKDAILSFKDLAWAYTKKAASAIKDFVSANPLFTMISTVAGILTFVIAGGASAYEPVPLNAVKIEPLEVWDRTRVYWEITGGYEDKTVTKIASVDPFSWDLTDLESAFPSWKFSPYTGPFYFHAKVHKNYEYHLDLIFVIHPEKQPNVDIDRLSYVYVQSHEHRERRVVTKRSRQKVEIKSVPPVVINATTEADATVNQSSLETWMSIKNNFCRVLISYDEDGEQVDIGNDSALNLCGDVFVMPKHFWIRMQEYQQSKVNVRFTVQFPTKVSGRHKNLDFDSIKEFPPELSWTHAADIVYLRFTDLVCGKNISKKFFGVNDTPNLVNAKLVGIRGLKHICTPKCRVHYESDITRIESIKLTNTKIVSCDKSMNADEVLDRPLTYTMPPLKNKKLGVSFASTTFVIPTYITYRDADTISGDCGTVVTHDDPAVVGKLMGLHCAADEKNKIGIAGIIFKEDVEEVLDFFKPIEKLEDTKFLVLEEPVTGPFTQAGGLDVKTVGRLGTYIKDGKIRSYKVNMPSKTKISKSLVFDMMTEDFGPNTKAPARLTKWTDSDGEHSPMMLGLAKMQASGNMIPVKQFDIIKEHICESILSWDSEYLRGDRFVLSVDDALNGFDGLKQVDIKTSAGFPYIKEAPITNKTPWLDIEVMPNLSKKLSAKSPLLEAINYRIENARSGKIVPTYFIDTLKDEIRPLDKVASGATRVFQVGPFDLVVAMRMYFGHFLAHCCSTYLEGEMAVGIDPESSDWTFIKRRHDAVGRNKLVGDFKHYDASATVQLAIGLAYCANRFYNDPENFLVRIVLVITAISADSIIDILIYFNEFNHSGNFLTTLFNNFNNMVIFRWTYLNMVDIDLVHYNDQVAASFFGDDNFVSVCDAIKDKFNMLTVQKCAADIGFCYTSADKSEITNPFAKEHQVTFLKRSFVKHDKYDFYMARLDRDSVYETARWCEGDPLNVNDQIQRFNQTLMFLAAYPRGEFDYARKTFVKYCELFKQGQVLIDDEEIILDFDATKLFTYDRCMMIHYPEYFKPYGDLSTYLKKDNELLRYLGSDLDV